MENINNIVKNTIEQIVVNSSKEGLSGVPSGFVNLDKLTQGFHGGELTVIASRPGMGKSSFLCSLVRNISIDFNKTVVMFSLEMSSLQLITRMISSETGLTSVKLRKGDLEPHEWEQLNVKVKKLSDAPIYVDDEIDFSINGIKTRIIDCIENKQVDIVFIDYIQLINLGTSKRQNREEELSIIIKELKFLARKYNVPIVITSQLSRAVENRGGDKRPLLSDIRDSGAIEDDADVVCFLYRPEHYGMIEWDDDDNSPCEGQAELIIMKNRTGGLGGIRLSFVPHLFKFDNLEEINSNEFECSINESMASSNFISQEDAFGFSEDNNIELPF
ncbi:replicative DNA helicase [Tenacibaculum finnmarkense]|uniref:replicative DNA helicase n=1 Tax=Tenacibaculum finnmarkense TaxID=2781243 RepID=UPI001EFA5138|nr:DnaB-like helicase C-terminal domain-containing protein [Tenacibaculum finnmarkense]MCG8748893.1 AAA family ATPase [Tenacibaculum finnmarkense]